MKDTLLLGGEVLCREVTDVLSDGGSGGEKSWLLSRPKTIQSIGIISRSRIAVISNFLNMAQFID